MKTDVQATSIHAFHTNAAILSDSRQRVAGEIYRLTKAGQPAYISLVSKNLSLDKSSVSARFNDLANIEDGFMLDGMRRKMHKLQNRVFDPESGKNGQWVNAWAIILYEAPQDGGAQLSMF